jgi:hypothetical protein
VAVNGDRALAQLNTIMNFRVRRKAGSFSTDVTAEDRLCLLQVLVRDLVGGFGAKVV